MIVVRRRRFGVVFRGRGDDFTIDEVECLCCLCFMFSFFFSFSYFFCLFF